MDGSEFGTDRLLQRSGYFEYLAEPSVSDTYRDLGRCIGELMVAPDIELEEVQFRVYEAFHCYADACGIPDDTADSSPRFNLASILDELYKSGYDAIGLMPETNPLKLLYAAQLGGMQPRLPDSTDVERFYHAQGITLARYNQVPHPHFDTDDEPELHLAIDKFDSGDLSTQVTFFGRIAARLRKMIKS